MRPIGRNFGFGFGGREAGLHPIYSTKSVPAPAARLIAVRRTETHSGPLRAERRVVYSYGNACWKADPEQRMPGIGATK